MKKGIHPEYREVAFIDLSINQTFIIRSSVQTRETVEIDGVTYPMFKLDTSSASHPFYTGAQTRIVEAGRVEKFRAKFAAKQQAMNAAAEAAKAASHPFYTGAQTRIVEAGRVEKFRAKFAAKQQAMNAAAEAAKAAK